MAEGDGIQRADVSAGNNLSEEGDGIHRADVSAGNNSLEDLDDDEFIMELQSDRRRRFLAATPSPALRGAAEEPRRTRVRVGGSQGGPEAEEQAVAASAHASATSAVQAEDSGRRATAQRHIVDEERDPHGSATSDDEEDMDYGDSEKVEFSKEVYITEAWRDWEREYLKRLAKRVHRLVCKEFERTEEALFMLFVAHDTNLDGVVRGDEATRLVESLATSVPAAARDMEEGYLTDAHGAISLLNLLTWFGSADRGFQESNLGFNVSSFAVGLVGSGLLSTDHRIDALSWEDLRRTVMGYRRVLQQVRLLKEKRKLDPARRAESEKGLSAAISVYHEVLAEEFDGDAEHLFELFCEVDTGGNELMLETNEVEHLLMLLDPDATKEDLYRYVEEINMEEGLLGFSFLMEWWTQAQEVPNSLVSEKGAALIAGIKARAMQRRFTGMFSETPIQKRWKRAEEAGKLRALRQAYCRTFTEFREVKMLRDLKFAEEECARP